MATQTFAGNQVTHDNYTTAAAASQATKTLPKGCLLIMIQETGGSNDALVSFDGGATFFLVKHGAAPVSFPFQPPSGSYVVKDAVDNSHATIQALYVS